MPLSYSIYKIHSSSHPLNRNDASISQQTLSRDVFDFEGFDKLYIIGHGMSNDATRCYYETSRKPRVLLCNAKQLARFIQSKVAMSENNDEILAPIEITLAICYAARTTQNDDHWLDVAKKEFRHTFASRLTVALGRALARPIVLTAFTGNVTVNKQGIIIAEDEFDTALSNQVDKYNQEIAEIAEKIVSFEEPLTITAAELDRDHSTEDHPESAQLHQQLLKLTMLKSELETTKDPKPEICKVQFKYKPGAGVKIDLLFNTQTDQRQRTYAEGLDFIAQTEANLEYGTKSDDHSDSDRSQDADNSANDTRSYQNMQRK